MKPSGTRGQGGAGGGEADGWGNWALDLYAPTQQALGPGSGARPHLVFVSEHLYSELADLICSHLASRCTHAHPVGEVLRAEGWGMGTGCCGFMK